MNKAKLFFLIAIVVAAAIRMHFEMDPDYFAGDSRVTEENVDNLEDSISNLHFEMYHMEQSHMNVDLRDSIFSRLTDVDSTVDVGKIRYENEIPVIGYSHYIREGGTFKKKLTRSECDSMLTSDFDHALMHVISKKKMTYDKAYIAAAYLMSNPELYWKDSPHSKLVEFDEEFIAWMEETKEEIISQK